MSGIPGTPGSAGSFIIAELDDSYTDYYEVSLESEWRARNAFVRGSYTWSRYEGNFDQDNSTLDNDQNIFLGSSNIADDAGRQLAHHPAADQGLGQARRAAAGRGRS